MTPFELRVSFGTQLTRQVRADLALSGVPQGLSRTSIFKRSLRHPPCSHSDFSSPPAHNLLTERLSALSCRCWALDDHEYRLIPTLSGQQEKAMYFQPSLAVSPHSYWERNDVITKMRGDANWFSLSMLYHKNGRFSLF